jgi:hypothetical protein
VPFRYSRVVILVTYMIGLVFVWLEGIRNTAAFSLGFLCAVLLALPLVLRLALIVHPPKLVTGKKPSSIITLDLRDDEANRCPKE